MTKFCTQCGSTVAESARFCNKCGAKLLPTQPASQPSAAPPTYQNPPDYQPPLYNQESYQPVYQSKYQAGAGSDLKPNIAAMLCYPLSFITGIIFLVLNPYNKDRFVRFHAYQSIFFFAALVALNICLGILSLIIPSLSSLLSAGLRLLSLGGTAWLMYQAYHGNSFKIPVLGDIAEKQAAKD